MPVAREWWRKSSRSNPDTGCVELVHTLDAVRDSKNGTVLPLSHRAVVGLLTTVKQH